MRHITKYNSYAPAKNWSNWIDGFFNGSLSDVIGSDFNLNQPATNVVETNEGFRIEMAAPGLEKTDFNITVEKDLLSIATEQKNKEEVKEGKYTRHEFNYTSFKRSFTLPENVDVSGIEATYENGVLNISLPKVVIEEEKPKQIDVG